MKKKKLLKIWNGRGVNSKEHLFIAAYSRADACRMLDEIYPPFSKSSWNMEIIIYFSEG